MTEMPVGPGFQGQLNVGTVAFKIIMVCHTGGSPDMPYTVRNAVSGFHDGYRANLTTDIMDYIKKHGRLLRRIFRDKAA